MPIGASRMTHHRTFCTIASAERTKPRNGSAGSPTLSAATPMATAITISWRTLNDSAPSARALQAEDVAGHQSGEEVEPSAALLGGGRGGGVDRAVAAGLGEQAQADADRHGDQCGDGEPQQRLAGEARGVGHLLEVGDADDHRGDDQGRDQHLQQRDEGAADGLEGAGQPVGRAVGDGADLTGDEPEGDTEDEGEEDLRRERDATETSEHEEVPFGRGCRTGAGRGGQQAAVVTRP